MNHRDENEIRRLLKDSIAPLPDTELHRDLWPSMLRRLDQTSLRVPWWDWVLLGATVAVIAFFPGMIPALLYQL
ncbi:MAG TPA: hypothetical protein VGI16_03255 [Candidatus Acidoferrum sp.]|jgi:hypothetical protein